MSRSPQSVGGRLPVEAVIAGEELPPRTPPSPQGVEFAPDSPLEGDGFEPSVPRQIFLAAHRVVLAEMPGVSPEGGDISSRNAGAPRARSLPVRRLRSARPDDAA